MRNRVLIPWLLFFVSACAARDTTPVLDKLLIVSAQGDVYTYYVELADNTHERSRGLMHRKSMPAEQGMLLVYPVPQKVSIWMKNTYLPLDIIYIDRHGEITGIVANAEPLSLRSMPSAGKVLAVLELNGGEAARRRIKAGDQVVHSVFK